jgi:chemotaxis protein CheD
MTKVKIGPGEHHVSRTQGVIIVTVLGSCVAACIRDPMAGVGGMNHFMLPESETGSWGGISANMRYGNFAMEALINDILRAGGNRRRLEIKVFGGARMITTGGAIGHQNADFVEEYLRAEDMPIAASHLRGEHARRIEYNPQDGTVRMLELALERSIIACRESNFLSAIRKPAQGGSIELFD